MFRERTIGLCLIGLACLSVGSFGQKRRNYIMCVPHEIYDSCLKLVSDPLSDNSKVTISCLSGRDRMDCLDKVNQRQADFLAVDPEDMYVAHRMKNEDFSVFSEIRTVEERDAEFRYEGIILIHKNSDIRNLNDLKGKKSCHTGFGRNVGYKIPITKLKKHGVLKISPNTMLSPVESELQGLSELFSSSCLVGTYSKSDEVNRLLKKRYSNLCALCEDPVKCDYPDKYSGYDGAIRCLVQNGGDVAFTKVIYVRRFFGLPIANNPPKTDAEANPEDYEYLCEDGTRRPINGPACSWAQRPWQGYMGNADVNTGLTPLQDQINAFYNNGKRSEDKKAAKDMWIKDENVVVKKEHQVYPGEHLTRAQYKDVIERDGSMQQKIRLCLEDQLSLDKCNTMKQAAYSRDIRPEFECVLSADCLRNVADGHSDAVIIKRTELEKAQKLNLVPSLYEVMDKKDTYLAVCDSDFKEGLKYKGGIYFDKNDPGSVDAAMYFNHKRGISICPNSLTPVSNSPIQIIRSNDIHQYTSKLVICPDGTQKLFTQSETCNFEGSLGKLILVRDKLSGTELENILHAFVSLSAKFGGGGDIEDVFELFGEFKPNARDVLFSDRAVALVDASKEVISELNEVYNRLHCVTAQ